MRDSFIQTEQIIADCYVMLPCFFEALSNVSKNKCYKDQLEIVEHIENIYKSEISSDLVLGIERTFLEKIEMIVRDDAGHLEERRVLGELYFSYQETIGIGVLILAVPDIQCEPTYFYDQVSRDDLLIMNQGEIINLKEYVYLKYKIKKCGTARTMTHLSGTPSGDYTRYLLSNEVYRSEVTGNASLCSDDIITASTTNIAQFDFFEMYAYDTSVMQIDHDFPLKYEERMYKESLTLFIIELLQFQDAAVNRVNYKVYEELHNRKNFSVLKIQEINLEFSKSIKFWNMNIFIYPATQKIANRISKAFEMEQLMAVYRDNKTFLEHVITTHSIIVSERETKILNYTVLILTLSQVIPIYYGLYNFIVEKQNFNIKNLGFLLVITIIVGIVAIISNLRLNRLRRG